EKLGLASPAMRIAVRILFDGEEDAFLLKVGEDPIGGRRVGGGLPVKWAEPFEELALVVERCDGNEPFLLTKLKVGGTATWGDVDNAGALGFADVLPVDDPVDLARRFRRAPIESLGDVSDRSRVAIGSLLGGQIVKWPAIGPADELRARQFAENLI